VAYLESPRASHDVTCLFARDSLSTKKQSKQTLISRRNTPFKVRAEDLSRSSANSRTVAVLDLLTGN